MMISRSSFYSHPITAIKTVPFDSVVEAWFWFIQAMAARNDGARIAAGRAPVPRPCEPTDILKVLDRLVRNRRLLKEHLLVLRHYGRRLMAPDPRRVKEARAYKLWVEALDVLHAPLVQKGIVAAKTAARPHWVREACVYEREDMAEGMAAE
ncbi:MAG: hypothetical protein L6Q57_02620 [Alphaproteobacteria bacterium]|nr:hypothetical protein [Alphaproteobacteria bacterium]